MKNAPVCQIHLFIAPSSSLWILSLGFSALRGQKVLPVFAAPRWLAHWLEPEGKWKKRRTPRVSPVRDQISHRMQGSTATPVDENNWRRKRREVGYIPARVYPSPIQLESLRTMHRSSRRPRDTGELAQCLFVACPKVGRCKGGGRGGVNSLELGEYSDPCEPQHDVNVAILEHGDGGRSENTGGREICEK